MIHPAKNLAEGDHYVVALRNLRSTTGARLAPSACWDDVIGFAVMGCGANGMPAPTPAYEAHLGRVVATLARYGVTRRGLYLAWDFTVDSRQNLTAPALAMRTRAFAALGGRPPTYRLTAVDDHPSTPSLARMITGEVVVPSFLTGTEGTQGTVLTEGKGGLPVQVGQATQTATFHCEIPKDASSAHPAVVGYYGHGLFNSGTEVYQSWVPQFSDAYDYAFCGTTWVGLSASTLDLAVGVVSNLSEFPSMADNLLQSMVNAQFVGRLLDTPRGLATNPAFRTARSHRPLIRTGHGLVYYGNSEGGIMGGAFTAVSTDTTRAVLGVPGMDYDVLLDRSADFTPFLVSLDSTYPTKAEQQIGFDLIQMLWDRAEADGYAEQMTGGLPGTPAHQVLLEEAFGDHQVANVQTETEARTIGASLRTPALAAGRSNEQQPYWGIPALRPGSKGPALTVWDSGCRHRRAPTPRRPWDPTPTTPRRARCRAFGHR